MSLVEMPQEAELLDDVDLSVMSLDELAARANAEHLAVERHLSDALIHALRAGQALLEAKSRHAAAGDWRTWCESNMSVSYRACARYIRLAFYADDVKKAPVGGVKSAERAIAHLPAVPNITTHIAPVVDLESDAKRLRGEGFSVAEVAEILEISTGSVWRLTVPGAVEKSRISARRRSQQRTAARRALAEKQKAEAIRKAGGNIATAYSYVRKAAAELDAALGDATSPEVRQSLRAALAGVHKAEDEIGKAVRHG